MNGRGNQSSEAASYAVAQRRAPPGPVPAESDPLTATATYFAGAADTDLPESIGRYRVTRHRGKWGFLKVDLCLDEQLKRLVAVKVPHAGLSSRAGGAAAYRAEARTVASLDHPHIVPVHDVGSTDEFPCYVVSKTSREWISPRGSSSFARTPPRRPTWRRRPPRRCTTLTVTGSCIRSDLPEMPLEKGRGPVSLPKRIPSGKSRLESRRSDPRVLNSFVFI